MARLITVALWWLFLLAGTEDSFAQRTGGASVTDGIVRCLTPNTGRSEYNACLLNEIKQIQPMFSGGIPELNIPPMDPLVLENINLKRSEPPVSIDAVFSNVRVSGINGMDIKYIDVDVFGPQSSKTMRMGLAIPALILRGQYKITGNIFLLPIEGTGNFISKLETVIVEGSAKIVPTPDGRRTTTENVNVGFKIRNMATKMDNLFQGNQILSDTIHHFLNQNGQLVLDEIRPDLTKTLNNLISRLFSAIFEAAPTSLHTIYLDRERSLAQGGSF